MARLAPAVLLAAGVFALACGSGDTYVARGVVKDVRPEQGQLVIAHEDIEGLMPAMTMNFDVGEPSLLERLQPGHEIEFTLHHDGGAYRVMGARVVGGTAGSAGAISRPIGPKGPAPDFSLIDQDGQAFSLSDLRGRAVVLDFIFTNCPGPCPIQTGLHVKLQRLLRGDLRARTHFVSISLDPSRDTPEALRAYAERHHVDLTGWTFLTGEQGDVSAVVERYHVGSVIQPDGEIAHSLITYLIRPDGNFAALYAGLDRDPEAMLRDLEALL